MRTDSTSTLRRGGAAILAAGLLVAMVAAVTATTAEAQEETPQPVVEAARQVSDDPRPARLYPIPEIAVHPEDPDTLVIGAAEARFGGCRLYTSRDGGLTWLQTNQDTLIDPYDFCVRRPFGRIIDLQFTPSGDRLYIGMGGSDKDEGHPNGPTAALFGVTENLGLDVDTTVVAEPQEIEAESDEGETDTVRAQHDHASVAIDPTDPDRVYRGWRRQSTVPDYGYEERAGFPFGTFSVDGLHTMIAVSEDGGETWGDPIDLTEEVGGEDLTSAGSDVPAIVTDEQGDVYVFTRERRPREEEPAQPTRLLMFRSTDGGDTWEMSVLGEFEDGLTTPDAAYDADSDSLHVVYEAQHVLEDAEVPEDEDPPAPRRVEFITSTDRGDTWSDPVDVVDPAAIDSVNQYFPGMSVAPGGRIDVAWWDFRDDPFFAYGEEQAHDAGERWAHVYWSYSTDGGRTWSADKRISDRLIDTSLGVAFPGAYRGTIGVASSDEAAYITWSDTRAATDVNAVEDVYMTRVRMQPTLASAAEDTGGPDLLGMGLGAGGALAVAGLVLMLGTRRRDGSVTSPPIAEEAGSGADDGDVDGGDVDGGDDGEESGSGA